MTNPNGRHAIQAFTVARFCVSAPSGDGFHALTYYNDPRDYERAVEDAKARARLFRRAQEEAER